MELTSKWLEKKAKIIERDLGRILDQFAEVFQELPKGGVKGRSSSTVKRRCREKFPATNSNMIHCRAKD